MNLVTFTADAVTHIRGMLAKDKTATAFRLSVKTTGCSGKSYVPALVTTGEPEDIHFMAAEDLPVYVERASEDLLRGVVVDFVMDPTGLKQKKLVYINPNEAGRCGCGESFTV